MNITITCKICKTCKESKPLDEFYLCKITKDGRHSYCKNCHKLKIREFQDNNKEIVKYRQKLWIEKNKDKRRKYIKKYFSDWKQSNPTEYLNYKRKYKQKWDRKSMLNPIHRLNNNLRGNMYHALKAKKGFRRWEDLVGYSLQDLINHLTPLLNENMNWENYGSIWHVDHIIPKSWFKYQSTDDPKFKECWALSNLQPKLKTENIKKGNRFVG